MKISANTAILLCAFIIGVSAEYFFYIGEKIVTGAMIIGFFMFILAYLLGCKGDEE